MNFVELPDITNLKVEGNRLELDLFLQENLLYFQGHFPEAAILPGVVQIHWAALWGQRWLMTETRFAGFDQVKFFMPAKPGDSLHVVLEWRAEKSQLHFCYYLDQKLVSSGRIRLGQ